MNVSLFYDRLTIIDYAFLDFFLGPVGHSFFVNVELIGENNQQSMILDFSLCKKIIKNCIDSLVDHKFVVPSSLQKFTSNHDAKKNIKIFFNASHENGFYDAPEEAICFIDSFKVTPHSICSFLEKEIKKILPTNVISLSLTPVEEEKNGDLFFHYTHGLKQHEGNCQRLFHGHYNKVLVFQNEQRSYQLEDYLVRFFKGNTHFVFEENIVSSTNLSLEIFYESLQGKFYASLPKKLCTTLPRETTVENLSYSFCEILKKQTNDSIKVIAFEGIQKGASCLL